MTIRGQITRLPFSTGNTNLPLLINYDWNDIREDILAWPSLSAFFDFSDYSTMTESGGEITQVVDLTGNFTATAGVGERATYGATAINGQSGLTFTGAQRYNVPGLMSSATKITVAAAVQSTDGGAATSRMVLADAATSSQNLYVRQDALYHFNGAVTLAVPSMRNRLVNAIWAMNYDTDAAAIYCDGLTATGTSNIAVMTGDANIGAWNDGSAGNRFIGSLGYLAVFDEDASQNPTLRGLLDEFALRRWRLA